MLPDIVRRALRDTVVNIGQLSPREIATLNQYAERGWISKGQGGPFPAKKTVWAFPGYPFDEARSAAIAQLQAECAALGEAVMIPFEGME